MTKRKIKLLFPGPKMVFESFPFGEFFLMVISTALTTPAAVVGIWHNYKRPLIIYGTRNVDKLVVLTSFTSLTQSLSPSHLSTATTYLKSICLSTFTSTITATNSTDNTGITYPTRKRMVSGHRQKIEAPMHK